MPPQVELVRLGLEHVDAVALLRYRDRGDIRRMNPSRDQEPLTFELAREAVQRALTAEEETRQGFVIMRGGEVVGDLGLTGIVRWPLERANVGVFVDSGRRGQGIGTAALNLACDLAFGELSLHALEAGAQPTNLASLGMIRRAGFTEIGLAPRFLFVDGEWRDHLLFQKLAPDPPAVTDPPAGEPDAEDA
jgi:ribosomal-protein-alanine N-acetyltransferase